MGAWRVATPRQLFFVFHLVKVVDHASPYKREGKRAEYGAHTRAGASVCVWEGGGGMEVIIIAIKIQKNK